MLVKLAFKYLKKDRINSITAFLGMAMASFVFCFVIFISDSMLNTLISDIKYNYGDYTIGMNVAGNKTSAESFMKRYGENGIVTKRVVGYMDNGNSAICYTRVSDNFYDALGIKMYMGRLPLAANEILVPKSLYEKHKELYSIGYILKSDVYKRTDERGRELDDLNYYMGEQHVDAGTIEGVIVGIYDDGKENSLVTVLDIKYFFMPENEKDVACTTVYSRTVDGEKIDDFSKTAFGAGFFLNSNYIDRAGLVEGKESLYTTTKKIVLWMVMISVVIGIFFVGNVFISSCREKRLEASVLVLNGATFIQIAFVYVCEAAIIVTAGFIFGFFLSVVVSRVFLGFLSTQISYIVYADLVIKYDIRPEVFATAFLISLGMGVLISVKPVLDMLIVSPVELLRENSLYKKRIFIKDINFKNILFNLSVRYRAQGFIRDLVLVISAGAAVALLICTVGKTEKKLEKFKIFTERPDHDVMVDFFSSDYCEIKQWNEEAGKKIGGLVKKDYMEYEVVPDSIPEDILEGFEEYLGEEPDIVALDEDVFRELYGNVDYVMTCFDYVYDDSNRITGICDSFENSFIEEFCGKNVLCITYKDFTKKHPYRKGAALKKIYMAYSGEDIYGACYYLYTDDPHDVVTYYNSLGEKIAVYEVQKEINADESELKAVKLFNEIFMTVIFVMLIINILVCLTDNISRRKKDYELLEKTGLDSHQKNRLLIYDIMWLYIHILLIGLIPPLICSIDILLPVKLMISIIVAISMVFIVFYLLKREGGVK